MEKMNREIRLRIHDEIYQKLAYIAKNEYKTISALIRELILQHVKN